MHFSPTIASSASSSTVLFVFIFLCTIDKRDIEKKITRTRENDHRSWFNCDDFNDRMALF